MAARASGARRPAVPSCSDDTAGRGQSYAGSGRRPRPSARAPRAGSSSPTRCRTRRHLRLRAADDRRQGRVEDRRVRRLDDVGGDDRLLAVAEDPGERAVVGAAAEDVVHLVGRGRREVSTVRSTSEPVGRGRGRRSPAAGPRAPGSRGRSPSRRRSRSARGCGGAAGAAEVLVRRVDQPLVAGVGVDRRHHAVRGCRPPRAAPSRPGRGSSSCRTRSRHDVALGVVDSSKLTPRTTVASAPCRARRPSPCGRRPRGASRRPARVEPAGRLDHDVDAELAPTAGRPGRSPRTRGSRSCRPRSRRRGPRRTRERPVDGGT